MPCRLLWLCRMSVKPKELKTRSTHKPALFPFVRLLITSKIVYFKSLSSYSFFTFGAFAELALQHNAFLSEPRFREGTITGRKKNRLKEVFLTNRSSRWSRSFPPPPNEQVTSLLPKGRVSPYLRCPFVD